MANGERRAGRLPGLVNGGLSLVMLMLLAAVALATSQPPPPSIAEFAPQAVEQIKDAPAEQSSDFGEGEGGAGGAGGATTTTTSTTLASPADEVIIDVKRVRRCIGDPPRQIEDPQSPPCVPYWEGDNGGVTWKGVTDTEIRVAVPDSGDEDRRLAAFFNSRFEFYGRKLVLINTRPDFAGGSPEQQAAAAVKADEERNVFASLDATQGGGFHYYAELARRQIVSAGQRAVTPESYLRSQHPHMWQYEMSVDRIFAATGGWTCARLANRPASHTTDPILSGKQRTFGLIVTTDSPDVPVDPAPFVRQLERCGVELSAQTQYAVVGQQPDNAADAALRMKAANVTTVVCFCDTRQLSLTMNSATGQGYFPEWIGTSYGRIDYNFFLKVWNPPRAQTAQLFGLTFRPRQLRPANEPVSWAIAEVEPGAQPTNGIAMSNLNIKYRSLLLLASGVQGAGPNLTPDTFADALHNMRFPNPPHPNMPGIVNFAERDHTMTKDATEWWWSNTARSPYPDDQNGTICYVDGGARRNPGAWPTEGDPFFTGPCDSGV